ncbi:MAG: hypothetical protein K2J10_03835 [Muribaculaceae bacterium]|nr:hypothetical protein [Muribaculaceae bacterium]
MKTKLLITIVCTMFGLQAVAGNDSRYAPIMWPVSYTVKTDRPFVYPLEEIGVKFDRAIKLMDEVTTPITIKCNNVVVAEATTLEIINNKSDRSVEGVLNVHFEKQNLPKGATYELCIPEGVIGWTELEEGFQLVNGATRQKFSVPSSLGPTFGIEDGVHIPDSKHFIVFYWSSETKAVGEPKFDLYREDEKIAELPAYVTWDWDLGQASPVFKDYMTFDNGVNYRLVLPAGSVSSEYREDITNEEVVFNFIGAYTPTSLPFTYTWCSLYTDHSNILGEVTFTFDRPIEIAENAKIQLYEIYPTEQLIMEVTPWLSDDANCWDMMCDFGGYQRDDEWGYTIVIPEGAVISAENHNNMCARSEFSSGTAGVESIMVDEDKSQPFYNLQGIRVDSPKPGYIYIHNGKKVIFR